MAGKVLRPQVFGEQRQGVRKERYRRGMLHGEKVDVIMATRAVLEKTPRCAVKLQF